MKRKIKRTVALTYGYLGTRFRGLQLQQHNVAGRVITIPTVENFLEHALSEVGGIHAKNREDLRKVRWSRASRTDSYVHAACNVTSLKMLVDDDAFDPTTRHSTSIVDQLNAVLPADIRVFSCALGPQKFRARHECNLREYHYMIPASLMDRNGGSLDSAKLEEALQLFEGSHCFLNFSKRSGHGLVSGGKGAADESAEGREARRAKLARIASMRTVYKAALGDAVVAADGTELVPIVLKGQSFLTRQIRFIVGACLGSASGAFPLAAVESALRAPHEQIVHMPLAPAQLLMVVSSSFSVKKRRPMNLTLLEPDEAERPHIGSSASTVLLTELHGLPAARKFLSDSLLPHVARLAAGLDSSAFESFEALQGGEPRLDVLYPMWREQDSFAETRSDASSRECLTESAVRAAQTASRTPAEEAFAVRRSVGACVCVCGGGVFASEGATQRASGVVAPDGRTVEKAARCSLTACSHSVLLPCFLFLFLFFFVSPPLRAALSQAFTASSANAPASAPGASASETPADGEAPRVPSATAARRRRTELVSLEKWLGDELPNFTFSADDLEAMKAKLAIAEAENAGKQQRLAVHIERDAAELLQGDRALAPSSIPKVLPRGVASRLTSHFDLRPGPLVTNLQRGLIVHMRDGAINPRSSIDELVTHVTELGVDAVARLGLESYTHRQEV